MVIKRRLQKDEYPRPHSYELQWGARLTLYQHTIVPLLHYDEGLGAPSSYKAHPENPSFTEANESNHYPKSEVTNLTAIFRAELSKGAIETDKLRAVRVGFIPFVGSFEDWDAKDELSGETIKTILRMQTEDTDNQAYPLYTATDLQTGDVNYLLPNNQPGLTSGQTIERVEFDYDTFLDCKQYMTNGSKLHSMAPKVIWKTVTRDRPISFVLRGVNKKVKRMNKKTFCGVLVVCDELTKARQHHQYADATSITHLWLSAAWRNLEWNQGFDMEMA